MAWKYVLSIEFDKVYLVQKKRIQLGWTDRELSFLLGFKALFVREIENPNESPRYDPTDTNILRRIFFNCKLSEIMSPKITTRYYKIGIVTKKALSIGRNGEGIENKDDGRRKSELHSFKIDIYDEDEGSKHFLSFTQEEDTFEIDFTEFVNAETINAHVDNLFNGSFFNVTRTALEVFENCVKKHGKKIRPCHVADAIAFYTKKRKAPRLVKGKRNEMRRETYIKEI